ncbi:hypothetical protein E8E14_000058 [Neopestalotiopsis sp. 37M]|nr:hypothetical protein E8E14_000058 [Neopestalotiopsis sp. 37M]
MDIGLQEVYSPPEGVEAVANICFVHGLFGGPWKSFSAKRQKSDAESSVQTANGSSTNQSTLNKKGEKKVFWPRELLPLSVNNVRIFTFGYDADIGKFMGAAGLNSLFQHARNLLNASINLLEQTPEPLPIIFVAHSLGGLVVKQALNQSATSTDSKKNRVLGYTRGIIFLGTPHHGSSAATYGRAAFRLGKTVAFQSANIKLLTALERNSESLDQLSTEFCETLEKTNSLRMWSFAEEKQIRFGVVGMQIVPADSARIRHIKEDWGSISGDHRQITKYASTRDDGFVKVSNVLSGWGMLKELLYQLLQQFPSFYAQIRPIYDRKVKILVPCEWDLESLAESFMQIPKLTSSSKTLRNRVFLFIDALDENENQQDNETMMKLIKRLSSEYELTAKNTYSPVLKICLASRSWPFFEKELGGNARIPSFAIHDFTANDIRLYASALLEEPLQILDLPVARPSDSQQLVNEIIDRANGVFVWVRVVVDNLRRHITDGTSIEVLRKKILEYPEELQNLYEYTVTRIPKNYWQELEMALKVLFSSQTALTLSELYVVTQICTGHQPLEDFQASQQTLAWLASRSGGLIEEIHISSTSGDDSHQQELVTISSVQFIHQTVQDFVRAGIKGLPEPSLDGPRNFIPPGYHLLLFACLHTRPPHPCISGSAKKVFSYFRECERGWDADPAALTSYDSTTWRASGLIDSLIACLDDDNIWGRHDSQWYFMDEEGQADTFRIMTVFERRRKWDASAEAHINFSMTRKTVVRAESIPILPDSFYMKSTKAVKTKDRGKNADVSSTLEWTPTMPRLQRTASFGPLHHIEPMFFRAIVYITQNLYYPDFRSLDGYASEYWGELATLAAVGQRVAKDRTDRPRMLKKVISSIGLLKGLEGRRLIRAKPTLTILDVKPAADVNWYLKYPGSSLFVIIATALPSGEITDTMLRQMAKLLLNHPNADFGDMNDKCDTQFTHRPRMITNYTLGTYGFLNMQDFSEWAYVMEKMSQICVTVLFSPD